MSFHKKNNDKKILKKRQKVEFKRKKEANSAGGTKEKQKAVPPKHLSAIGGESDQKWFDAQFDEVRPEGSAMPTDELVQRAQKRGEELLSRDIVRFAQAYRSKNRADADWLDMVANRGTFPDRLSALQLRIRRSAVHALPQLRQFVQTAQQKGAKIRQAHTLTKTLKELFLHDLLPSKRKLVSLAQRPLEQWITSTKPEADKRLMMWHFEAELKQLYHQFVEGLQTLAGNTAEGVALAACQDIAELLAERPEQEQQLLSALVNKLGHPTHRVGAGVAQCLERTVAQRHPNMRSVLIQEVERLLFRKNISPKAQRYALHFLSRIILDAGEAELALQLIRIYLKLFQILVEKDALAEFPKLLPLLISGLNRAFPYAKGRTAEVLDNVNSLYTIVHTAKFSTALSVLRLLFQIHSASDGLTDRFYAAFYHRLFNLQPGNQQHDTQLFTLAQQVLRNDLVECRVRAFLKRFFQIALAANSAFAAAILLMCHSVVRDRPQLIRTGKTAISTNEGETKVTDLQQHNHLDDMDDEEHYDDVKLSDDEEGPRGEEGQRKGSDTKRRRKRKRGWQHRRDDVVGTSSSTTAATAAAEKCPQRNLAGPSHRYNPLARNPLFAGAEWTMDDELATLAHHFHPTVAAFAQALLKGQPLSYRGDPLIDLSQMRFLDRFAFKNPKKKRRNLPAEADADGTENACGGVVPSLFAHSYAPSGVKALNPTSQDYLTKKDSEIPLDERFLHHFAKFKFEKEGEKPKRKAIKDQEESDDEVASLDSDEFDTLMERFEPGESREIFDVDFGTEFGRNGAGEEDEDFDSEFDENGEEGEEDESDADSDGNDGEEGGDDFGSEIDGNDEEEEEEDDFDGNDEGAKDDFDSEFEESDEEGEEDELEFE